MKHEQEEGRTRHKFFWCQQSHMEAPETIPHAFQKIYLYILNRIQYIEDTNINHITINKLTLTRVD